MPLGRQRCSPECNHNSLPASLPASAVDHLYVSFPPACPPARPPAPAQLPPWQSEAITRGVRVRALPVFVPEQSVVGGEEGEEGEGPAGGNQYFFAYR